MKVVQPSRTSSFWLSILIAGLLAGCASHPKSAPQNFIAFPPPPDEPHIQYLTSFGAESDMVAESKLRSFVVGSESTPHLISKPYGIAVTKGTVYVCDTLTASVSEVDLKKHTLRYSNPEGQAGLRMPIGVAVDADDTRYVTDTGRNQVLIYGKEGQLLRTIGKKNDIRPCGIAASDDRFYVTDLSNHCVRVYNKSNGDELFQIPRTKDEKAKLFSPTNVAVDDHGKVYVTDTGDYCVRIYDAEGNYLRTLGDLGMEAGQFVRPKGIAVDRDGRVYVVDAATSVTQVFDAQGRLLMYFGEPKTSGSASLYLPAGIAIDYSNTDLFKEKVMPGYKVAFLIFVTNQLGPQKVSVYGFLQKS